MIKPSLSVEVISNFLPIRCIPILKSYCTLYLLLLLLIPSYPHFFLKLDCMYWKKVSKPEWRYDSHRQWLQTSLRSITSHRFRMNVTTASFALWRRGSTRAAFCYLFHVAWIRKFRRVFNCKIVSALRTAYSTKSYRNCSIPHSNNRWTTYFSSSAEQILR